MISAEARQNKSDYTAERRIPKDSIAIEHPEGKRVAVVYLYLYQSPRYPQGRLCGVGFQGKSRKSSFHQLYHSVHTADSRIAEFFQCIDAHRAQVASYRAEQSTPHTLRVNDVICRAWGYDQTNVNFYRVARVTSNYVWLKPLACKVKETGNMCGLAEPQIDTSDRDPANWKYVECEGEAKKHRAHGGKSGNIVSMKYGSGSQWDGDPRYCSWYA